MGLFSSLAGEVTLEVTSADISGLLRCLQQRGIRVAQVETQGELDISFQIRRKDYRKVKSICEKRGESPKIVGRQGVFWKLLALKRRPVLTFGMLFLLYLSIWVPGRVFFIRVEGNASVPDRQIVEAAQGCGIGFGASRRQVRSEKVKNALLSAMPQLQWAGVNTYGCTAVITVKERAEPEQEKTPAGVSSIVALRDAVIGEMTVLKGNALCRPGQAVKAGEVLISGYTDCGIYIQATQAKGEVFGYTQRNVTAFAPTQYTHRGKIRATEKKYSLIIGKKRINLSKDSGNLGAGCAKIKWDYILTLPGGFQLPVALQVETVISYEQEMRSFQAEAAMSAFARSYLQSQMVAGTIEKDSVVFSQIDGFCRLDGVYSCYEMIGITRPEEIQHENH